jgi:hypothetical protein
MIRIAAGFTLKRLFYPREARRKGKAAIVLSILHGLASILDLTLICRPISAQWRIDGVAVCGNQWLSFLILEVTAILLDCLILIIPIFNILRLQLSTNRRLALLFLFETGAM